LGMPAKTLRQYSVQEGLTASRPPSLMGAF
jgi:hypothetical protein